MTLSFSVSQCEGHFRYARIALVPNSFGSLEARLAELRKDLERGFEQRADALVEACAEFATNESHARATLRLLAHRLKGIAGTYGHTEITELARALEHSAPTALPGVVTQHCKALVRALRTVAEGREEESTVRPIQSRPPNLAPETRPMRILAVDDDPNICKLMELTFARLGHHDACVLEDPSRALLMLRDRTFDCVIVDAMMPISGLDVCHSIRALPHLSKVPIVVLSAAAEAELGWDLNALGPITWLRKPFRPATLLQLVEGLVLVSKAAAASF